MRYLLWIVYNIQYNTPTRPQDVCPELKMPHGMAGHSNKQSYQPVFQFLPHVLVDPATKYF